ncbi:hypothetical protein SP39_14 [Salmonella phage 39]|nr:hypothetical protein SP39_14 [Salmonella phage 39]
MDSSYVHQVGVHSTVSGFRNAVQPGQCDTLTIDVVRVYDRQSSL